MQTRNAVGNLVNRYRAVLKKCNIMNVFGSLAIAGMLVMGSSVGVAVATPVYDLDWTGDTTKDVVFSELTSGTHYKLTHGGTIKSLTIDGGTSATSGAMGSNSGTTVWIGEESLNNTITGNVDINQGQLYLQGGAVVVNVNGMTSIGELATDDMKGALNIVNGSTYNAEGGLTLNEGFLTVDGGAILNIGTEAIDADLLIHGEDFSNSGTTVVHGNVKISKTVGDHTKPTLNIDAGTMTVNGNLEMGIASDSAAGSGISVSGGAELTITGNADLTHIAGDSAIAGDVIVGETITVKSGGPFSLGTGVFAGDFTTGALDIVKETTAGSKVYDTDKNAVLQMSAGTQTFTGLAGGDKSFFTGKAIEISGSADATLQLGSATTDDTHGGFTTATISLNGITDVGKAVLKVQNGEFTTGAISVGSATMTTATFGTINLLAGGELTTSGGITVTGNSTVASGSTLAITGAVGTVLNAGNITLDGGHDAATLTITGNNGVVDSSNPDLTSFTSRVIANDLILTKATDVLTLGTGGVLHVAGTFTNKGLVSVGASTTLEFDDSRAFDINDFAATAGTGVIGVASGGTIDFLDDLTLNLTGTSNDNKLTLTAGDSVLSAKDVVIVANGDDKDLTITMGTLTVANSLESTGTVILDGGAASDAKLNLKNESETVVGNIDTGITATKGDVSVEGNWTLEKGKTIAIGTTGTLTVGSASVYATLDTSAGTFTNANTTETAVTIGAHGELKANYKDFTTNNTTLVGTMDQITNNGSLVLMGIGDTSGLTLDKLNTLGSAIMGSGNTGNWSINGLNGNDLVDEDTTLGNVDMGMDFGESTVKATTDADTIGGNAIIAGINASEPNGENRDTYAVTTGGNTLNLVGDDSGELISGADKVTINAAAGTVKLGQSTDGSVKTGGTLTADITGGNGDVVAYNGVFEIKGAIAANVSANGGSTLTVGAMTGTAAAENGGTLNVKGNVTGGVTAGDTDDKTGGDVDVTGNVTGTTTAHYGSTVSISGTAKDITAGTIDTEDSGAKVEVTGAVTGAVTAHKGSHVVLKDNLTAGTITANTSSIVSIAKDATITSSSTITNGASVQVGGTLDLGATTLTVGNAADTEGGSRLVAGYVNIASTGKLLIDPEFFAADGTTAIASSEVFIGAFGEAPTAPEDDVTSELSGLVGVGMNSMLSVGTDKTLLNAAMLAMNSDRLNDGKLEKDGLTAALYLHNQQNITLTGGLLLDGSKTTDGLSPNTLTPVANKITLGANSLLVVNAEGLQVTNAAGVVNPDADSAALTFDGDGGKLTVDSTTHVNIVNAKTGTITLVENFDASDVTNDSVSTDTKFDIDDVSVADRLLKITAISGLADGAIADSDLTVTISFDNEKLSANMPKLDNALAGVLGSYYDPANTIRNPFIDSIFDKDNGLSDAETAKAFESTAKVSVSGSVVPSIGAVGSAGSSNAQTRTSISSNYVANASAMNFDGENTTLVAVADGNSAAGMKNGIGLWVMPMYQSHSADGLESGNYEYGYDTDFGGVSVGSDYTFANSLRLGAAFHVGSGSSESTGDFSGTDTDFDYYGFSLYTGYHFGANREWGVSADIGYTMTDNEIDQTVGNIRTDADVDSSLFTAGVRGEYKFALQALDIIPHIGIRVNHVSVDSFNTTLGGATVSKTDDADATTVQFPIGATFSKEILTAGGWNVNPSLDLGVMFTAGDTDMDQDVRFTGAGVSASMDSEVADAVTFQGGLGIGMSNGSVDLNLDYNINASSNVTSHGIFGTFRYNF